MGGLRQPSRSSGSADSVTLHTQSTWHETSPQVLASRALALTPRAGPPCRGCGRWSSEAQADRGTAQCTGPSFTSGLRAHHPCPGPSLPVPRFPAIRAPAGLLSFSTLFTEHSASGRQGARTYRAGPHWAPAPPGLTVPGGDRRTDGQMGRWMPKQLHTTQGCRLVMGLSQPQAGALGSLEGVWRGAQVQRHRPSFIPGSPEFVFPEPGPWHTALCMALRRCQFRLPLLSDKHTPPGFSVGGHLLAHVTGHARAWLPCSTV